MGLTRKQIVIVVILLAGTLLAVLNQTLLSPALPAIMTDTQVDATTVQWLTSAYSLVEAVVIPLSAYLIGRFPTKKLFIFGMTIFGIGSLLAAIAPFFAVLLVPGGRYRYCYADGIHRYLANFPTRKTRLCHGYCFSCYWLCSCNRPFGFRFTCR